MIAEPTTLIDLLEWRATYQPDAPRYTFLVDGETREAVLTYAALARQARAIAGILRTQGAPGERVLICHPPGLDYIVAFFGCLYAGMVAVPAYPADLDRPHRTLPRLLAMLTNAQARIVVTTSACLPALQTCARQERALQAVQWVASDGSAMSGDVSWSPPPLDRTSLAFVMYTSGSTGTPKGIMVSHENVLSNLRLFHGFDARPCRVFVSWLPLFHDLGLLFGVLHPLYRGVPAVLMSPLDFVQRPFRWLQALSRYGGSTTGGPNFAYDLCVRKVTPEERQTLDLSHWNMALNGAEPVRAETLDRFVETFAPCGFRRAAWYPSYGLADATATVSGGTGFTPPLVLPVQRRALEARTVRPAMPEDAGARVVVGCGQSLPGQTVRIVDPERCTLCLPDQVGEIWVAGPGIGQGYWNRPTETAQVFQGYLADTGEGPFLRTGDMGFVYNGEVIITGRLKDLIIIQGRNHAPEDIEVTVEQSHPSLRAGCGAAFAVDSTNEERLVVVQEVQSALADDLNEAVAYIRQAIVAYHDISPAAIVLLQPGSIPKTSSGKIQRHACQQAFLAGELTVVKEWSRTAGMDDAGSTAPLARIWSPQTPDGHLPGMPVAAIQAWLVAYVAERLNVPADAIDIRHSFSRYGLASAEAISLVVALERWLGHKLSPTLAWEYPSIALLSHHLADDPGVVTAYRQVTSPPGWLPQPEPVAIVGMGCRFPGAASPAQFWQLLCAGHAGITEVPPDRWDMQQLYDPDPAAPGKMITRWGGFLHQLEQFDAAFFGIAPREAPHVDPRQRLMLEVAWEALEDAGIPPDSLAGSRTSVFVAVLSNDYDQLLFEDLTRVDAYSGPGTANSIVANRLSYFFDIHGPSVALDTACSGSLVALHLACQSLHTGESTLALVGGVSVNLMPRGNVFFSKAGAIAPDGRCKTFDARADGIVRSEGCGVVVLKPLAQALANGDPIYAVIKGSAVNSDGRSNGMMAPNGFAQEAVLGEAYQRAGHAPARVQYIEAHGTGTRLGDPIEIQALTHVLGQDRPLDQPCMVGSVKTNLGHMEPAAGIAGVIKTALAIHHRLLPPSIHFDSPNPLIPFEQIPLRVQQTLGRWPRDTEPLIAGVSSFGFGGTNAHVVLHEPPTAVLARDARVVEALPPGRADLLCLSARSPAALYALAGAYQQFVIDHSTMPVLSDICFTANLRRMHHDHRLALVVHSRQDLADQLMGLLQGHASPRVIAGQRLPHQSPQVVFIFSGQGSHWHRMGCTLLEQEPVFQATIKQCDQILRQHVSWSLQAELQAGSDNSRLAETDVMQPAIFAIQVALAALWRSWGIQPAVVVGQSLGEIAAAHVAGALRLEAAIQVVVQRSRLMKTTAGKGRTAVVRLPLDQAQLVITGREDRLAVAGSISPTTSVLSGDPVALDSVLTALQQQGIFCRLLADVDVAFHSPQMEPLQVELVAALADLTPQASTVPLFSTVTAALIGGERMDASYWGRHLREPFHFAAVMEHLIAAGYQTFLEVSPHPVLAQAMLEGLRHAGQTGVVLASLRRETDERTTLLEALGELYVSGHPLDWSRLHAANGRCVSLPSYPWQREYYWLDQLPGRRGRGARRQTSTTSTHPLLGDPLPIALLPGQHVWEAEVSTAALPYLDAHRVQGNVILPGAAYLEMALAAGTQVMPHTPFALEQVTFTQALFLAEDATRSVQLGLIPIAVDQMSFQIFSQGRGDDTHAAAWNMHASGNIVPVASAPAQSQSVLQELLATCTEPIAGAEHYAVMAARGLEYGSAFQLVERIWRREGAAVGRIGFPQIIADAAERYHIHPIILDAGFQIGAALLAPQTETADTYLPVGLDYLQISARPTGPLWCSVSLVSPGEGSRDTLAVDMDFLDETGRILMMVRRLRLQRIDGKALSTGGTRLSDWLYTIEWQRSAPVENAAANHQSDHPGSWLLFADSQGVGSALAHLLEARGEQCTLIRPGAVYQHDAAGHAYEIDPTRPDHVRQMFADLLPKERPALRGIIHLWNLDAPSLTTCTPATLEQAQCLGCESILQLVQVVAPITWSTIPRLWVVTRGSQSVSDDPPDLAVLQTAVWGLGRVLALEHPESWGGLIDLDPAVPPDEVTRLLEICWAPDGEDQIAFRGGHRHVARLVRFQAEQHQLRSPRLRPDGSYLITGGLGGLGLEVAHWLVEQGARRLILLGRTALPPRSAWQQVPAGNAQHQQIAAIRALEAAGASVHLVSADVADETQLAAFYATYQQEAWPPIRGVIHAAGIVQDQLLIGMTTTAFRQVLRPKVGGAWLLHRLFETAALDFFILFSSAAAVLGQVGQGNYAAGNAFMDGLAHYRRARGLPAMSLNWGAWSEVGMAARRGLDDHFARNGMTPIAPEQGRTALQRLVAWNPVHVAVIPANWQQRDPAQRNAPFLSQLTAATPPLDPTAAPAGASDLLQELLLLTEPAERLNRLHAYLQVWVAQVLRLDPAHLDPQQPLNVLGLDSIMAIEVKHRIEQHLGVTISVTDLLMGMSVSQMANKLLEQLHAGREMAELLAEIAALAPEERETLLAALAEPAQQ